MNFGRGFWWAAECMLATAGFGFGVSRFVSGVNKSLASSTLGWDGMGWDGMGWDGMEWDGMEWDGMG